MVDPKYLDPGIKATYHRDTLHLQTTVKISKDLKTMTDCNDDLWVLTDDDGNYLTYRRIKTTHSC